MRTAFRVVILCVLAATVATAQESPFVPPETYRLLSGEISGDISYDHLRHLTLHHSPNGASRGFRDKMRWIAAKAKEVGLEDVRIIDDLRYSGVGWTPLAAELWIVSPDHRRLIGYGKFVEKYEKRGRRWFVFEARWRDETGLIIGRSRVTMAFPEESSLTLGLRWS